MRTDVIRAATEEDLPGLVVLAAERASEEGHEHTVTAEDIRREWERPHFDLGKHGRVVERDGRLVANAMVWLDLPEAWIGGFTSRDARGRGLGTDLFAWAVEVARDAGAAYATTSYSSTNRSAEAFITTREGFRPERRFRRMVCTEPGAIEAPVWPAGASLIDLPEDPVPLLVALRNASFEDHWNFHPWTEDEVRDSFRNGERDVTMCFVAAVDGEPAALCNNGIHTDDAGTRFGYLGPIGTMPAFRGTGIGRALLRHAVRAHAERGVSQVSLWVDTENRFQAVGMYERNGFTTLLEHVVYRRDF